MSIGRRMGLMALAALPGLGPIRLRKLDRAMDGAVERLLELPKREQAHWVNGRVLEQLHHWKQYFDPDRVAGELEKMDGCMITSEEATYPERLNPYPDRPVGLYCCRNGRHLGSRSIAIVGTRQPSGYGRKVARIFSAELSHCGFTIVSGMAEGIDTEAHRAALSAGGLTAAVLGGGLKRCYPAGNYSLMKEIEESGGVWSEFPLWRRADRRSFPQRNRIVSGLSEAVVVIESGESGGSLITARMAAEQGKSVYAIPGRIDAPQSTGCHALIRDGAILVDSVDDILEDLSYRPGEPLKRPSKETPGEAITAPKVNLSGLQEGIWEVLGRRGSVFVDDLAIELNEPVREILRVSMEMQLSGLLEKHLDGRYERSDG